MSEETAVADPVDSLPEEQMDFSSALDAAFANLDVPQDPESVEDESVEGEVEVEENEETTEDKTEVESGEEEEAEEKSEEDLESFDPTDELDAEIGEDWTPKAASRFKQLKAELKTVTGELETLRQEASESQSKVKELTGEVGKDEVQVLKEKLQAYEQEKMFTDLEETEAYQTAITKPLDTLIDSTRQIAEKYEVSPDELVDVNETLSVTI